MVRTVARTDNRHPLFFKHRQSRYTTQYPDVISSHFQESICAASLNFNLRIRSYNLGPKKLRCRGRAERTVQYVLRISHSRATSVCPYCHGVDGSKVIPHNSKWGYLRSILAADSTLLLVLCSADITAALSKPIP
jgi:hypothetical protein